MDAGDWTTTFTVYGELAGMTGTVAIGPVDAELGSGSADVLDYLKAAGMAAVRTERGDLALTLDAMYFALGAEHTSQQVRSEANVDQTILVLTGTYIFSPVIEGYAGLRYQQIDADVAVSTAGSRVAAADRVDWLDPLVGARVTLPLSDAWRIIIAGDIGGFGVGSDFTWCVLAAVDWQVGDRIGLTFGFRTLGTDYEAGSGNRRIRYDTTLAGPGIGVRFRF